MSFRSRGAFATEPHRRRQSVAAGRTSTTPQSMDRSSAAWLVCVAHSGSRKVRSTTVASGVAACFTAANNRRDLHFFEPHLSAEKAGLAEGFEAVSVS